MQRVVAERKKGVEKLDFLKYANTNYTLGNGCLEEISTYKHGRIALVVDSRVIKALKLEKKLYEEILKDCEYRLICDVSKEPTVEMLKDPIEEIKDYQPKYIVAIGGGSVIDAGKTLWLFYEHPDYSWDKAFTPYEIDPFSGKAKLIAVPTTSGTGSETTCAAVVKNESNQKKLILTPEIMPSEALLDFDLLNSLPPNVIAFSGTDALAHAIESATSQIASSFVYINSVYAAIEIIEQLPKSFDGDLKARERMHIAATLAGAGISNSITGLAHGMDFAGGDFDLPHGLVTGMLLPYTMEYLMPNPAYEEIAAKLNLKGNSEEKQKKLIDKIFEINQYLGMPASFKEAGVNEDAYLSKIGSYVNMAKKDANVTLAAKMPNDNDLEKLFQRFYYGRG